MMHGRLLDIAGIVELVAMGLLAVALAIFATLVIISLAKCADAQDTEK